MKENNTDNSIMKIEILTVKELAKYLKVEKQTIYRLLYNTDIPCLRLGKKKSAIRFDLEKVKKWLEKNKK